MNDIKNTFSCNKYLARGKSHKKNNTPCQDYCDYYIDDEFSIIALSDGAGSCKYSHFGSELLVKKIILYFKDNHKGLFGKEIENIKEDIIKYLSSAIENTAKIKSIEEKELSATLLFVCCYKDKFIYGHVGDGIICCDIDGNLKVLSGGQRGEFKNETVFFRKNIDKNYFNLSIKPLKNILSFYCFSDGLEPVLISNKDGKLSTTLQTLSLWIYKYENEYVKKNLQHSIDDIAENDHNIHDDLSLIIMNIDNNESIEFRKTKERILDPLSIQNEKLEEKFEEQISFLDKKIEMQNNSISDFMKKLESQNNNIAELKAEFKKDIEKLSNNLISANNNYESQINNLSAQNKNNSSVLQNLTKKLDDLSKIPEKLANLEKTQSDLKSYFQKEIFSIKSHNQNNIEKVSKSFSDRYKNISQKSEEIKKEIKNNLNNDFQKKKKNDNYLIFIPVCAMQVITLILLIITIFFR